MNLVSHFRENTNLVLTNTPRKITSHLESTTFRCHPAQAGSAVHRLAHRACSTSRHASPRAYNVGEASASRATHQRPSLVHQHTASKEFRIEIPPRNIYSVFPFTRQCLLVAVCTAAYEYVASTTHHPTSSGRCSPVHVLPGMKKKRAYPVFLSRCARRLWPSR